MTQRLSEAEQNFLKRYVDWLETMEDGLTTVSTFYHEGFTAEGDRLLREMMEGFRPLGSSSMSVRTLFSEEEALRTLHRFEGAVNRAVAVEEAEGDEERFRLLREEVLPAFQGWKLRVVQKYQAADA
ncbi:hypothetical protein B0H94_1138 [Salsuginibacillus halophilus]|uniref:DUF8042 domain-containing protein n=1 Tax=Salsuginibacillus halophilus TaxID=517424 RepID=A0A2P8H925_9BACI|nr:hypothetical protein [Salsuginibacillus halophilus]PSL42722.1 hypothetical protein B0H94_1138 [Salsuginibacillus halophilus]